MYHMNHFIVEQILSINSVPCPPLLSSLAGGGMYECMWPRSHQLDRADPSCTHKKQPNASKQACMWHPRALCSTASPEFTEGWQGVGGSGETLANSVVSAGTRLGERQQVGLVSGEADGGV